DENKKECLECKLLPICHGGCARRRRLENASSCYMNSEMLDKAFEKVHQFYKDKEIATRG
ncbi:MAG: hypothetical protein ABIE74_02400, partial [Pseudomonadota bacterium]